jgi:hypothetical protein
MTTRVIHATNNTLLAAALKAKLACEDIYIAISMTMTIVMIFIERQALEGTLPMS